MKAPTANEIYQKLCTWSQMTRETTGDGLVLGDGEREVHTVAVTIIASPRVIRLARDMGADMILTHEPTLQTALAGEEDSVVAAKRALCEEVNIPILRFHDHMHFTEVDKINLGVLSRLGLEGDFDGQKTFTLATPMPASQLITHICDRLSLRHPRYIGQADLPVRTLSLLFGAWGDARIHAEFSRPEVDLAIIGEGCEYSLCEYVRDAVELGAPKGLLILGHMGSEKAGMEYLTDQLNILFPNVRAVYIDAGEVYN